LSAIGAEQMHIQALATVPVELLIIDIERDRLSRPHLPEFPLWWADPFDEAPETGNGARDYPCPCSHCPAEAPYLEVIAAGSLLLEGRAMVDDPLEHLRGEYGQKPLGGSTPSIKPVRRTSYAVPWAARSFFHEELGWYATADDRVLGVVVRDKHDADFGWIVLMRNPGDGLFRALDLKVSLPSEEEAAWALWTAMREWAPHEAVTADFE
jgi:hypothetical protein